MWPRWVASLPEWRLLREDARVQQIIRDKLPEQQSAQARPGVND